HSSESPYRPHAQRCTESHSMVVMSEFITFRCKSARTPHTVPTVLAIFATGRLTSDPSTVSSAQPNAPTTKTGISQDNRTDAGIAAMALEFVRGDVLGSLTDGFPSSPCPGPCPDAERTSRVSCLILEAVS